MPRHTFTQPLFATISPFTHNVAIFTTIVVNAVIVVNVVNYGSLDKTQLETYLD